MSRHSRCASWPLSSIALPMVALLAGLAGCGTDEPQEVDESSSCGAADEVDTYTAGMQRETAGGGYKVELVDALPAPPEKGVNVWTLRILDAELAPADGVSVSLEPFMPEHGHGTSPATFYGVRQDEPGTFVVSDLNLTMPGIWDVTVHVTSTDAAAEDALFTFCAEG